MTPQVMRAEDVMEVAELERQVQAFPWTAGHFSDALKAGYDAWVLRGNDGELLAFCLLMNAPDVLHLLVIAVRRSQHRRGLGTMLLQWCEARARALNVPGILLEVRPSNTSALAFYAKHGFEKIGVRRNYYPAPYGEREDAFVMKKEIFLENTPYV